MKILDMKSFFTILLFFWIGIAFFNVTYNSIKIIYELHEWGPLTDYQKRHKIFGDLHDFFSLVKNHTQKSDKILIFSNDGEKYQTYFLGIYYLYPRIVTTSVDKEEFEMLSKTKKFQYIAIYNAPPFSNRYEKIASFSSKSSTNYGAIFKLNE